MGNNWRYSKREEEKNKRAGVGQKRSGGLFCFKRNLIICKREKTSKEKAKLEMMQNKGILMYCNF